MFKVTAFIESPWSRGSRELEVLDLELEAIPLPGDYVSSNHGDARVDHRVFGNHCVKLICRVGD